MGTSGSDQFFAAASAQGESLSRKHHHGRQSMTNAEVTTVVDKISDRHAAWFKYFRRWRAIFWGCGILAATASALAASSVAGTAAPYFAVLSSICIAILGFTNPQRRANGYVAAWRIVGSALLRYAAGDASVSDLVSAVDRGEAIIGEIDIKDANEFSKHLGAKRKEEHTGI
jgi:hypothetical protein